MAFINAAQETLTVKNNQQAIMMVFLVPNDNSDRYQAIKKLLLVENSGKITAW
jgi:hypothetical protein